MQLKDGISVVGERHVYIDADWEPLGVTAQFMENADTYHSRYYNNDYWKYLIGRAIEHTDLDINRPYKILDIGSGSGNTVFATSELLPNSVIYASDISPQLLHILVDTQNHVPELKGRIQAYCFDLHKEFFTSDTFDLIVGGAILHHMLDPIAALKNVAKSLKSGGKIILFEPLEIGAHMMCAIYLILLAELELDLDVDPKILTFFKALSEDYEARFGVPRVKSQTNSLDDKWMFHKSYLRDLGNKVGLTLDVVIPTEENLDKIFTSSVRSTLRPAGLDGIKTPEKLWTILNNLDMSMTAEMKKNFSPEGIIIFSKPNKIGP